MNSKYGASTMMGALGGLTAFTLLLVAFRGLKPGIAVLWSLSASVMWLHANSTAFCGAVGW